MIKDLDSTPKILCKNFTASIETRQAGANTGPCVERAEDNPPFK